MGGQMEQGKLLATTREVLGKKVRSLRRQGIIPGNLFGHGIDSVALQCDTGELQRVLAQAGKTGLIGLRLDKAKQPRNVVVREIQRNPLTGKLLHVGFYQVIMGETINVQIPIVLVGDAPALKSKENALRHELDSLDVECLPNNIPSSINVDISSLAETGQAIQVKDIMLSEGIIALDHPEHVVVRIGALSLEKVEEVRVAEVVKAPEAAPLPREK
jgi:large subunit ribosomal protein L25